MTQQPQDLDIDIHLPTGTEQLPATLFRRFDQLVRHLDPRVATAFGIYGFVAFQSLGSFARTYFLTSVMWWAVMVVAIAGCLAFLMPRKYRLFYLLALIFSVGVGLIWQ